MRKITLTLGRLFSLRDLSKQVLVSARVCTTSLFLFFNIARGGETVVVKRIGEKYRCNVCGNEVEVTKVGGGTLVCCGEDMELIS